MKVSLLLHPVDYSIFLHRENLEVWKLQIMVCDFDKQLEHCRDEVIPAFKELRELFWPHGRYRNMPTADGAVFVAQKFAAICERQICALQS